MHHTIPGRHDYPSGDFYSWLFDRDRGGNRTTKFCLATYLIPLHMVWQCGGHQNRPTNAQETTRFGTWLPTSARPPRPTHPPPFTKVTNLGGQAPTHTLLTLVKNISVKLSHIVSQQAKWCRWTTLSLLKLPGVRHTHQNLERTEVAGDWEGLTIRVQLAKCRRAQR